MDLLSGLIVGVLVTVSILKRPITININTKHEEVLKDITQPDILTAMNNNTSKEMQLDKLYQDDMLGLVEEINKLMTGGDTNGRKE